MSIQGAASEQAPVTLYTYMMSPYAAKVHCFLHFKRLRFRCFYVNPMRAREQLPVGKQVPVVTIGCESRNDSTPIGLWLDEVFPDHPRLLPEAGPERDRLLALDTWVTNRLIPGSFRSYPGSGLDHWLNGWKLSRVMAKTADGGIPFWLRAAWPLFITRVPFVRRLVTQADDGLPRRESKLRLYAELLEHLGSGPYLGGCAAPSLPDLAAYPQFALYWATGFRGSEDILAYPELMAWLRRLRPQVTGDPPLVSKGVRSRELP